MCAQVPRLSAKQKEALRMFNALALSDKLRLDFLLQPGDIQMLSNHTQLHTRSAFEDHEVARSCSSTLPLLLELSSLHASRTWPDIPCEEGSKDSAAPSAHYSGFVHAPHSDQHDSSALKRS
jgi:hypothetical protein